MFLAIEWVDGSGKATQTDLLQRHFSSLGYRVATLSFPRYGEWSSVFVERFLSEALGDPKLIDPYVASTFYALDRFAHRDEIRQKIAENDIVISDRYVFSNALHRGVDFFSAGDHAGLDRFLRWLFEYEFERMGLPYPDMTVFLSLSIQNIQALLQKKFQERRTHITEWLDVMERDMRHQTAALEVGRSVLPRYLSGYRIIDCEDEHGDILAPDHIMQQLAVCVWELIL